MDKKVPKPPDARREPGHSRESVHLDPPAPPAGSGRGGGAPPASPDSQADGYADDVKNPPDSQQNRR